MSDVVRNPEDQFSCVTAHISLVTPLKDLRKIKFVTINLSTDIPFIFQTKVYTNFNFFANNTGSLKTPKIKGKFQNEEDGFLAD